MCNQSHIYAASLDFGIANIMQFPEEGFKASWLPALPEFYELSPNTWWFIILQHRFILKFIHSLLSSLHFSSIFAPASPTWAFVYKFHVCQSDALIIRLFMDTRKRSTIPNDTLFVLFELPRKLINHFKSATEVFSISSFSHSLATARTTDLKRKNFLPDKSKSKDNERLHN